MRTFFMAEKDENSSFCIGNGKVAAYLSGGDIEQLFGPVYSMPSVCSLFLTGNFSFENRRREKTAIWETKVMQEEKNVAKFLDFTHPTLPVFFREVEAEDEIEFSLASDFSVRSLTAVLGADSLLFCVPQGSTIFALCKTDKEIYCSLVLTGNAMISDGKVHCGKGKSCLCFAAGESGASGNESFSDCMAISSQMLTIDREAVLLECHHMWHRFCNAIIPTEVTVSEVVEDVAIAVKTQTSVQGGILAGKFYHLAYGRDSYGDIRGYLALGLYNDAKRCIAFFSDFYEKHGFLPNAAGMGTDCSHCHENDGAEQTAYCLLLFSDYFKATKDIDFLKEKLSFIRWLMQVQKEGLHRGMMPFNGDETYIAGGLLPRSAIDGGAMEATALYIASIENILAINAEYHFFDTAFKTEHQKAMIEAKDCFLTNFVDGERVFANHPKRAEDAPLPLCRHGVYHGCGGIMYLHRAKERGYLCTERFGKATAAICRERYALDCALFMPSFAGCHILPEKILKTKLRQAIDEKRRTFYDTQSGKKIVGYEYGLLLYAAAMLRERCDDILEQLLRQRMCYGVWSEYYKDGNMFPSCPYRPWESAINMIGSLEYTRR